MKKKTTYRLTDLRTILALAGLVVLGLLVMSAIDSRKGARITGMSVEIIPLSGQAYMIQADEIKSIVFEGYRRDIEDLTVEAINLKTVETVLESEPFVEKADVFIDADDQLDIRITQSMPVARIMDTKRKSYYLTATGQPVPISKHASARVTVFSGKIDDFNIEKDTLTATQEGVLEVIDLLNTNTFGKKMIEQIHVTNLGEFLVQPKMGNFKFNFGKPLNLKDKLERMELAYTEILPAKGWNRYKKIDLSIDGQIICKK